MPSRDRMVVELLCYMNGANPGERVILSKKEAKDMIEKGHARAPSGPPQPDPTKEDHETENPNPPAG